MKESRFTLAFKMISITAFIVGIVAISITTRVQKLFENITSRREADNIQAVAASKIIAADSIISGFISKISVLSGVGLSQMSNPKDKDDVIALSFFQDRDIVSLSVIEKTPTEIKTAERLVRSDYFKEKKLNENIIDLQRQVKPFPQDSVFAGNIEIRLTNIGSNTKSETGTNNFGFLTIGIPVVTGANGQITHIAIADFKLDSIFKTFSVSQVEDLFLLDKEGSLIFSGGKHELPASIFEKAVKSVSNQGQYKYSNMIESTSKEETFVSAYAKSQYGLVTVAQVKEKTIFVLAHYLKNNVIFVAGSVLSASLFFIFLFSLSISNPIEKLSLMALEVAKGNFDVHSTIRSKDEIGTLAKTFNHMVDGLKERDKIKNVLTKFHGSSVAEDMLKRELSLGGQRKNITVFFSDVRDFTKFSEGHSPEEVVHMLNEYFEIMVKIVTDNHGVVDKFVGDAMMAVWGSPKSSGDDNFYALKACLEMRRALEVLNEKRIARNQIPIKIGMGLHSGPAISGTIGSSERMEYTVIGDTVNMASRIESSTKAFGTDLLVSQYIAEELKEKYLLEKAGAAEVKGKSEPLVLYKVKGFINEKGEPVYIRTAYSDYEAGHDAKVKVA